MKIVVAPNAFKGSMTAAQAARAMKKGVLRAYSNAVIVEVPVTDGGDGFLRVLSRALGGEIYAQSVRGPGSEEVEAAHGYIPGSETAIVEMALASGLVLLSEDQRDPMFASTFGTGELILAALERGPKTIVVGVGGSATNDGGIGAAAALGARFLDAQGRELPPLATSLGTIARIDLSGLDRRLQSVQIEVFCDVQNPLIGRDGAARTFASQKGATARQIQDLDAGLANLATVIQSQLGIDVGDLPGAGAGGGLSAGLFAFLGARLRRGVDGILDLLGLDEMLVGADLVLTGEGRIDSQTMAGKAPAGVAAMARARDIPCLALAGSLGEDLEQLHGAGINAVFSICTGPMNLDDAMKRAERLLEEASEQAFRCFLATKKLEQTTKPGSPRTPAS